MSLLCKKHQLRAATGREVLRGWITVLVLQLDQRLCDGGIFHVGLSFNSVEIGE